MRRGIAADAALLLFAAATIVAAVVVVRGKRNLEVAPTVVQTFQRIAIHNRDKLVASGNILGASTAPTKLIEFSDFQCPFCREFQQTMREFQSRHPNDVAVVYRQFPLPIHAFAHEAAIASECAANEKRFPAFANLLFAEQDSLGSVPWTTFASRAGVQDTTRFKECMASAATAAEVDTDVAVGSRLGITGTPAIIVGDEMLIGALPLDTLESLVSHLRGAAGAVSAAGSQTGLAEARVPSSH